MAEAALELEDDYYGVLNVPRGVDVNGLQTAYVRLSDDLAARMSVDLTARDELIRLNRAFAVLSNSGLRQKYDAEYFEENVQDEIPAEKRGRLASNALFGTLIVVVAVQVAIVGFLGRAEIAAAMSAIFGPLEPGGAG